MQKLGNKTKWALMFFGGMVLVLNAAETALFGANYISGAFGTYDDPLARMLAAAYVVLMLDVAYLVWFSVFLGGEQSTEQRDVALVLAIMALVGSIAATVTQLSLGTELAPSLVPYRSTIGTVSFVLVVGVTVGHILGFAAHKYFDPEQRVKTETAVLQGEVYDSVFDELKVRIQQDKDVMVDALAAEYRKRMLNKFGFRVDLKLLGKQGNEPVIIPGEVVEGESETAVEGESRIVAFEDIPDDWVITYALPMSDTTVQAIEALAEKHDALVASDLTTETWNVYKPSSASNPVANPPHPAPDNTENNPSQSIIDERAPYHVQFSATKARGPIWEKDPFRWYSQENWVFTNYVQACDFVDKQYAKDKKKEWNYRVIDKDGHPLYLGVKGTHPNHQKTAQKANENFSKA